MEKRLEQNLSGEEHVHELLKEVAGSVRTATAGKGMITLEISCSHRAAGPESTSSRVGERSLQLLIVLLPAKTALSPMCTMFSSEKGVLHSEMLVNEQHPSQSPINSTGDICHLGYLILLPCSLPPFCTLRWPRKIFTICLWCEQEWPSAVRGLSFAEGGC